MTAESSPGCNITFTGYWLANDRKVAKQATELVAARLGERLSMEPTDAWQRVFPQPVEFAATGGLINGHHAWAQDNKITVMRNRVTVQLVIHELGHLIPFEPLPAEPPFLRTWRLRAPDNGYISDRWKDGYQQHPLGMKGWSKPGEQWADMWLNWVRRSFADNENGQKLFAYVETAVGMWKE